MFLTLCLLSAIFLLLFFLHLQNMNVGYISSVAAFLIPSLFLPVVFHGGGVGVSSGGSPLFNLSLIFSQGAFLAIALFSLHKDSEANPARVSINSTAKSSTLFFGFVLLLMQFIAAFTSSPRVVPVVETFLFSSFIIVFYGMSFDKLQITIVKVNFFIAIVVLLGILLRFRWGSVDEYSAYFEPGIYISPFNSFLGLPSRVAGPFGSGQDLGIFCSMSFALTVFKRNNSYVWVSFQSLVFIFLGTLSGSRTFYISFFTAVLLKTLSSLAKKLSIKFLPIAIPGLLTLYLLVTRLFLPVVTSSENVNVIGGRSLLWKTIVEHSSDNRFLGHGPNTLAPFMHTALGVFAYGHAHNSILQYLWDFGIPGALAVIFFIISWLVTINSQQKSGINKLCILLVFLTIQTELTFQLQLDYRGLLGLLLFVAIIDSGKSNSSTQKECMADGYARERYEK